MVDAIPDLGEVKVESIRYTLKKFDGDYSAEELDAADAAGEPIEPVEVIVIDDEKNIVEHYINGEDVLREGGNS